jgi:hypothetical protein
VFFFGGKREYEHRATEVTEGTEKRDWNAEVSEEAERGKDGPRITRIGRI